MAVDDLVLLNKELPEVFDPATLPPNWDEDLIFISVEDAAAETRDDVWDYLESDVSPEGSTLSQTDWVAPNSLVSEMMEGTHPGVLQPPHGKYLPPPDALAFYLPFHYFFPDWWGVYLLAEGVQFLADFIWQHSGRCLPPKKAWIAARTFLYAHEAYHHRTESFATRLEITHRTPLYKIGFEDLYMEEVSRDDSSEEALATAAAYDAARKLKLLNPAEAINVKQALSGFIDGCPPSYRAALKFLKPGAFKTEECAFAERNQRAALPSLPGKGSFLWRSFPHAFSGISRINSRVNYVIHRQSTLATRGRFAEQYFRYRDVASTLKQMGCHFVRPGKGSHEIWMSPRGATFPIPNHRGDLPMGTLRSILRESGLDLSIEQFRNARSQGAYGGPTAT